EDNPCIVYSGNTQARHLKETGPKGCCLVTLNSNAPANIRFMPTDVVSYRTAKVDVSGVSSINDVLKALQSQVEELAKESLTHEGLVIKLVLTGRTPMHNELQHPGVAKTLAEEINTFFNGHSPWIIIDLSTQTSGTYDIDSLKEAKDFVADLINLCEDDQDKQLENKVREAMKPVFESWAGRKYLDDFSTEETQAVILKARNLALDKLVNSEGS
ncbi:MAG: hypothetical protein HN416_06875, partial [Nitrospina sp.]|nr:hypothetical protein [Nitrospina sp.]